MNSSSRGAVAPVASVIIPAYDEGRVIGRCLSALLAETDVPVEIVVAANGCSDDTVEIARSFDGVTVLDLPEPSKVGALNAGDRAAQTFPRIFLDADIVLGPGALAALVDGLCGDLPVVAAPHVRFATEHCTAPVRWYYRVYEQLPYVKSGLIGLGVYGLSEAGRRRFTDFPDVQADDLFVQRLFRASERRSTDGWFEVRAPRDLSNVLKVRTRVARGNTELAEAQVEHSSQDADFTGSTGQTLGALARLVARRPTLLPGAAVYLAVVALARRRAAAATTATWHRDTSTR